MSVFKLLRNVVSVVGKIGWSARLDGVRTTLIKEEARGTIKLRILPADIVRRSRSRMGGFDMEDGTLEERCTFITMRSIDKSVGHIEKISNNILEENIRHLTLSSMREAGIR